MFATSSLAVAVVLVPTAVAVLALVGIERTCPVKTQAVGPLRRPRSQHH
jgi:hypothetical protein